jgi:hypothetical protein
MYTCYYRRVAYTIVDNSSVLLWSAAASASLCNDRDGSRTRTTQPSTCKTNARDITTNHKKQTGPTEQKKYRRTKTSRVDLNTCATSRQAITACENASEFDRYSTSKRSGGDNRTQVIPYDFYIWPRVRTCPVWTAPDTNRWWDGPDG